MIGVRGGILLVLGVLCAFLIGVAIEYFQGSNLKAHGVRTEADLVSIYDKHLGRDCSYSAKYSFTVYENSKFKGRTFQGVGFLADCDGANTDVNYKFAMTNARLPIVYDAANPAHSALNFNDSRRAA